MAANLSLSQAFYVLNLFPSFVMFGMNGFYVSASEEIQGHHGPLVPNSRLNNSGCSGPIISIIKLIRDLRAIYTVTKFGADWFIFADVRG